MKTDVDAHLRRAAEDRKIFRRFAKTAGLGVAPRSIRSCRPPYVELTRMTHPSFANAVGLGVSQAKRTGVTPPPRADIYDDRLALRDTLARKATKFYHRVCSPLDLLIHIDGIFHPPRMRPEWAQAIFQQEGGASRWDSLWLYDSVYDRVVARWTRE